MTSTPFKPTHTMDSLTLTAEIPPTSNKFRSSSNHPPKGIIERSNNPHLYICTDEFPQHRKQNKLPTCLLQKSLSTLITFLFEAYLFTNPFCLAELLPVFDSRPNPNTLNIFSSSSNIFQNMSPSTFSLRGTSHAAIGMGTAAIVGGKKAILRATLQAISMAG
jgi:hypothetical protein